MKKTILMNTETLDNDLIISEKNIKAGESFPLHWHDYFELEIIISGCIEHTHNQQKYIATAGNAYLMSYYDFHSFKAITDAHLIGIRFNDTVLCGELTAFISMGIHKFNCMYDKSELENIIEQLNKIAKENEGGQLFSRQIIINTVSELVISIIRKSDVNKEKTMPRLIQQVVTYLYMHFREDTVSLQCLSKQLNVSANYLGSLFQSTTGTFFREYLNMLRLKYACRLLLSSDLSVKEVAYASGYKTNEHFLRSFKNKLGMTPSEYRHNISEDNSDIIIENFIENENNDILKINKTLFAFEE